MKRLPVLPVCVLLVFAGAMIPLFAKAPEGLKKSPVAELSAEAKAQIGDLKTWTVSAEEFENRKDDIRRSASVLAVLGQAMVEHPEGKPEKLSPLGLRDAGLELAAAKTHEAAMKSLQNIDAALEGVPNMRAKATAWKDLISMDDLMHVVNTRNSRVIRSARRSRDPEGDALHAQTIAVLTLVMAEQAEDYLSEEADIKDWKKHAQDFHAGMTDLAIAFKAKDQAGIKKHLDAATQACNACHKQFRDPE